MHHYILTRNVFPLLLIVIIGEVNAWHEYNAWPLRCIVASSSPASRSIAVPLLHRLLALNRRLPMLLAAPGITLFHLTASIPDRLHILDIFIDALAALHYDAQLIDSKNNDYNITHCHPNGGATAIHHAAGSGSTEMVKRLIAAGIPANQPDSCGTLALHWSNSVGHYDVCRYFIEEQKVPVDTLNDKKRTPLYVAMEGGYIGLVDLYIKHGASLSASCTGAGPTLLHFAGT